MKSISQFPPRLRVSAVGSLLLCAVLFLCGCSRSSKISRHLDRGQTCFQAEQFDRAEIEFLNVLRLEATNALALRQLGLSYHQQGRFLHAYAFLQEAAQLDPANDEVRVRLAGILLASRKLTEARAHAEAVLSRNPSHEEALMLLADTAAADQDIAQLRHRLEALRPHAESKAGFHLALGTLQLRQRHTNEAMADFQRALALNAQSSPAHLAVGNVFALLKDAARADFHLKTAAQLAPVRSARRVQYADFKLRSGDLSAAKSLLESVARQAPDYLLPQVRLAEIALAERRFDEAAALGKKILTRDPGNYEALLLLGRVSMARGEPSDALGHFDRLVAAYPRVPHAHHQLALALLMNQNPLKAIASLHQALALDPQHTESILLLAELNMRKNDLGPAVAALQQLVREQPQVAQSHLLLAHAHRVRRELDAAIGAYENMGQIFPGSPQPPLLIGQVLLQQGKKSEARQKFQRAVELAPDFLPPLEELVDLDLQDRHFPAAHKRVSDYIEKHPKAAAPFLFLAKIHSAQTNHLAAEQALRRAIELDSAYHAAYLALARAYVKSNKHQEAIDKLNAVLAQSTNNVAAWMQLGMIHNELKNYSAARDAYEKLLAVEPRFFPALNNLAYLYSERFNQLDKAYHMARSVRNLRPFDPVVADTFGWILFQRAEYPWALSLLQESANSDKMPKSPEVLFHLGMTHYMLGEEQPARDAFERALEIGQDFPGKAEAQQRLALLAPTTLPALERQIEANPRDPILLARVASLYEQFGSTNKALAAYRQALQHHPKSASLAKLAHKRLAILLAATDPAAAYDHAIKARAALPEDPEVARTLGILSFHRHDYARASQLLHESSRLLPDDAEAKRILAELDERF